MTRRSVFGSHNPHKKDPHHHCHIAYDKLKAELERWKSGEIRFKPPEQPQDQSNAKGS